MNDEQFETLTPLAQLAATIPNRAGGIGVSPETLGRWATRGLYGHKLESRLIGGVRMSSRAAVARLFDAINHTSESEALATA